MAYFYLFCGECPRCMAADEPLCERLKGYVGVDCDGGYASRTTLPARNALPLPGDLDAAAATAIRDAIATPVHVARRGAIAPGDRVAIVGARGGVGVHMVQVPRLHGAEVAGLDNVETKLRRLRRNPGAWGGARHAPPDGAPLGRAALVWQQ